MTWYDDLSSGRIDSARAISAREGVGEAYVGQIIKLAFLAPDLVAGLLEGKTTRHIDHRSIARGIDLPMEWEEQRQTLVA